MVKPTNSPIYCYIYRVWCVERMCFLKNSSQASWMGGWRLVGQEQLTTFPHLARLAPTCIFFPPILLRLGPTCSCCHFFPFPFLSILCLTFADVSCVSGTQFLLSHSRPALFCPKLFSAQTYDTKLFSARNTGALQKHKHMGNSQALASLAQKNMQCMRGDT